ncbi:hypothetical protein A2U01_0072653, partial [Trifolium medium]|nr:hypothetical protein [Trifolium medium]
MARSTRAVAKLYTKGEVSDLPDMTMVRSTRPWQASNL